MAVGLDLDTEYIERGSIPSGGAGTLSQGGFADFFAGVWLYRPSSTATYALTAAGSIIYGQASARQIILGFNSAGSNLVDLNLQATYNSGGGAGTPYLFPLHTGADFLDEWMYYFFYEDASNNLVAGYIQLSNLAVAVSNSYANDNAGSQYINTLTFGNESGHTATVLGYYAYARARDSAASAGDVLTYAASGATIAGDWGFWPLDDNTDTTDDSGNARTLTFGGTLTTQTSPSLGGPPPTITVQPANVIGAPIGGTASYSITATGGTLSYQWKDNSSGSFSNVGTNSSTYTTGTLTGGENYLVRCDVTDSNGTTTSNDVRLWVTTKYNPAWQGLYARAGRNFVLAQAILPTSKAAGNIFDNALFDEATSTGITGTLAKTNANDTAVVSGTTTVLGTLARTNVNDGRAISGTTTILATLARTNGDDTAAISGVVVPSGTISKTEVGDSMAASGSVGAAVSGTLAKTDVADTTVAAGTTTIVASVTKTDIADTASAAGTTTVRGDGVVTNSNDTMVASGSIGSAVFGTLATTNLSDSIAAAGAPVPTGTIAKTNTDDGMSASGASTVLGVLIATNRNDTLAANGTSGTGGTAKILWNKLTVVVRNSL